MKENYFDSDLEEAASPLSELLPERKQDAPDTPVNDKDTKSKRQFMGHNLSTLLIAGGVMVVLLTYALWPDDPPSPAFIPDHQTVPDVETFPTPPRGSLPETEQEPTPQTEPEPFVSPPVDAQALQRVSEASQQGLSTLNSRVSETERRLAELEAQLKVMKDNETNITKAINPSVKRPAVKSTTPVKTSTSRQRKTGVDGWRVHTIYPGMAWITHGGSTWSVQVGDNINGLTIRSINANARTVTTDKGLIRQED